MNNHRGWEPVIGLEIHAQLNTVSKLFSSDYNRFGDEPNVNISEVSVAIPGSLPVVNRSAVRKAMQFGLAIQGKVQLWSRFDRKSYFYPDCPRNFQITQFDHPIVVGGSVTALVNGDEKQFSITKVQLEDDAGMLKHFSTFAGVDFNRAGVPLIEIVSDPCMHSAKEAAAYAMAIRSILDYLDASDCNMEEGSLRFDVNVSVRKEGEKGLRNRIEIKNMNSFSNLEQAINHEIERQIAAYEAQPAADPATIVEQCTYRWDPDLGATVLMRTKEDAEDYRYFPEPDLPPLVLTEEEVERERGHLIELPLDKERRFVRDYGLSAQQSYFLTSDRKTAAFFEEALSVCHQPKAVANWIAVEFTGRLKEKGTTICESGLRPADVGELVLMIQEGVITGKIAKSVADDMVAAPNASPRMIVERNPAYRPLADLDELKKIIDDVVATNEQSVKDFMAGRDRALGFLVGQIMKRTHGSAHPDHVNRLLKEIIARRAEER
jgi:aspartyl-tRNA(Asn)/glutamyl-tRNA(Gln) amidotransferase subunit B